MWPSMIFEVKLQIINLRLHNISNYKFSLSKSDLVHISINTNFKWLKRLFKDYFLFVLNVFKTFVFFFLATGEYLTRYGHWTVIRFHKKILENGS